MGRLLEEFRKQVFDDQAEQHDIVLCELVFDRDEGEDVLESRFELLLLNQTHYYLLVHLDLQLLLIYFELLAVQDLVLFQFLEPNDNLEHGLEVDLGHLSGR